MIAVIFELQPAPGHSQDYFDHAKALRPVLDQADGFISVERFESLAQPGRYLSLSFWRDKAAVRAWRCHAQHRGAQQDARNRVLADYRLRVASVLRDYGLEDRAQVPEDSLCALR